MSSVTRPTGLPQERRFGEAPQTYGGVGQLLRAKSQFKRFAASKGIEFSHGLAQVV